MVCCGLGRDDSVGSAAWRACVLVLVSGLLGLVTLVVAGFALG